MTSDASLRGCADADNEAGDLKALKKQIDESTDVNIIGAHSTLPHRSGVRVLDRLLGGVMQASARQVVTRLEGGSSCAWAGHCTADSACPPNAATSRMAIDVPLLLAVNDAATQLQSSAYFLHLVTKCAANVAAFKRILKVRSRRSLYPPRDWRPGSRLTVQTCMSAALYRLPR